jgi:pyruvate/2-oxoglutarate dehydrogenase complex dihydrolipoamide acyltransferase (E2) component
MATPIINLPQVWIPDLEAVVKRPVVVTDAAGNDAIAIRPMTILGLSWDHRALDGALSAQFLAAVKRELERAYDRGDVDGLCCLRSGALGLLTGHD